MTRTQQDPFELLRKMQQESLENAPGLPQEIEATKLWSGVGFRIGDMMLVGESLQEQLEFSIRGFQQGAREAA